eukprot:scaffold6197_cov170-Isochrysis_galbana.AAC.2
MVAAGSPDDPSRTAGVFPRRGEEDADGLVLAGGTAARPGPRLCPARTYNRVPTHEYEYE